MKLFNYSFYVLLLICGNLLILSAGCDKESEETVKENTCDGSPEEIAFLEAEEAFELKYMDENDIILHYDQYCPDLKALINLEIEYLESYLECPDIIDRTPLEMTLEGIKASLEELELEC